MLTALAVCGASGAQLDAPSALGAVTRTRADPSTATLEAAAAQWPDRVQLLPLAQSGDGPPALIAALWLQRDTSPRLPGLLIGDAGLGRQVNGAVALEQRLARIVFAIAARIDADDAARALLSERPLYIAPRLGPLDAAAARRTFAHDFPSGWLPHGFHAAADAARPGAYPLSTPEAAALAALLAQSQDLGAFALFDERAAELPGEARERGFQVRADARLAPVAGHPLRHAREDLGMPALALDLGAEVNDDAFVQRVLELLRTLPRLELSVGALERLGPQLWQLDVSIAARVDGVWAEPGCLPEGAAIAVCAVESGVLETAACQREPGAAFEALAVRANECRLPRPSAAQSLGARLLVRAPLGATVRVAVRAPRFGECDARVTLEAR
ncbi:MAG: hypothetical protein EPO68_03455 [Planctomycetota bacterium]|nr:MAG: hypothetical protein EPO68_03455 [Planctomycetota bacterium]